MIRAALAAGALALAGCVPIPFPHGGYYRPDAQRGTLSRQSCGEQVGPETRIRFPVAEGVTVSATSERRDGGLWVWVSFDIAQGNTLRLASGEFALAGEAGERHAVVQKEFALYDAASRKFHGVAVDAPIEARERGAGRSVELRVPGWNPPRFSLTLPELEVNGARIAVAPVSFEYRISDIGLYPFNC